MNNAHAHSGQEAKRKRRGWQLPFRAWQWSAAPEPGAGKKKSEGLGGGGRSRDADCMGRTRSESTAHAVPSPVRRSRRLPPDERPHLGIQNVVVRSSASIPRTDARCADLAN